MEGSSKAEASKASASSSPSLSFELDVNEIKLCLDCINRERLNLGVFVFSNVALFHASQDDNYLIQMQLSGPQVIRHLCAVLWWFVHDWTDGRPEATSSRRLLRGRFGLGSQQVKQAVLVRAIHEFAPGPASKVLALFGDIQLH